jgi:hypothetical protein
VLLEALAVDLGVHEDAGQVVRRPLPALGDEPPAALEDLGDLALHDRLGAFGVEVRVPGAERRVHEPRPDLVVLRRDAHEAADHAADHGLGHVRDQVAGLAPVHAVQDARRDGADRVLVLGDALGGEAALEERLEAVVLGRVHADEHRPHQFHRQHRVRQRGDAPALGRVGLPVAADGVHVGGLGDRPESVLLGILRDALGPVDRTLGPQAAEELVRRAVLPQLALRDQDLLDGDGVGVGGHAPTLPLGRRGRHRHPTVAD